MNDQDLVAMVANISRSFVQVERFVSGMAYVLGILFMIHGIMKLKKIAESKGSQDKSFVALMNIFGGAMLIFLPTAVQIASNTTFGNGNVLEYASYTPFTIYQAMRVIVNTAGLIWFVRGCVLLVHASEPGVQDGPKGLAFLFGGVLAMNFEKCIDILNYLFSQLVSLSNLSAGGSS